LTKDGKPYAPQRYKQIAFERYLISKHTNTSYSDTLDITPTERTYLIQFISDDLKLQQQKMEEAAQKAKRR